MSDQPFYAPNRKAPPRQPRAGERLWTVEKNGRRLACELRDDGAAGVEVQMSRDGEFLFGRRCASRELALEEADARKAQYLREGGVLIAQSGVAFASASRCRSNTGTARVPMAID